MLVRFMHKNTFTRCLPPTGTVLTHFCHFDCRACNRFRAGRGRVALFLASKSAPHRPTCVLPFSCVAWAHRGSLAAAWSWHRRSSLYARSAPTPSRSHSAGGRPRRHQWLTGSPLSRWTFRWWAPAWTSAAGSHTLPWCAGVLRAFSLTRLALGRPPRRRSCALAASGSTFFAS